MEKLLGDVRYRTIHPIEREANYLEDFARGELKERMTKPPKERLAIQEELPFIEPSEEVSFPTSFVGPKYEGEPGLGPYSRGKNNAFKWLAGIPTQVLSRSPVFRQLYWRRIVQEAQLLSPDDAQELLNRAKRDFDAFDYNLTAPMKVAAFSAAGAAGMEAFSSAFDDERLSVQGLIGFAAAGALTMYAGRKVH